MKQYLTIVFGIICVMLAVSLFLVKRGADAQQETDASAINDFSNKLDLAQLQLSLCNGSLILSSNSLVESQAEVVTFSNQLAVAGASVAQGLEQITNLNQQVVAAKMENQTLALRVADLTNQVAGLSGQVASAQASLVQTNQNLVQAYKDYGLLENRLRRDVAERLVVERKFHNPMELQAQRQQLKENPFEIISSESIYAGLNVEVKSNGDFHVVSPD
jgi:chromosome segregation ATPase